MHQHPFRRHDPDRRLRRGRAHASAQGQPALQAALSAYNTGDFDRGFANGYVARYYGPGATMRAAGVVTRRARVNDGRPPVAPNPYEANIVVYVRETMNIQIR